MPDLTDLHRTTHDTTDLHRTSDRTSDGTSDGRTDGRTDGTAGARHCTAGDTTDVLDQCGLRGRVQASVDAQIAQQRAVLADLGSEVVLLVDAIEALVRGGKRLRAAFLYWGYRCGGRPDSDALVRAATSMEYFQAAALLHDDVMDRSDTRRGMPSAHQRLAAEHATAGWDGEGLRFGEAGAILAGDLCLTWTDGLYAGSGLPAADLARGRAMFDTMRTQLMGGQFLDVLESVRPWSDLRTDERVERAMHVVRYKSAKYTIEHPLLIGATAAGLGPDTVRALGAYGLRLGEAFQLRDDLLGVFGDPASTGKPAGDDLREGKRTVLVALTLDTAPPGDQALVDKLLGLPDLDADGVRLLRAAITASGAVEAVEAMIAERAALAREHLARAAGLDPQAAQTLHALVGIATDRAT